MDINHLRKEYRLKSLDLPDLPEDPADFFFQWLQEALKAEASREELDQAGKQIALLFENLPVPCPPFWGGYSLYPMRFEFWQGFEDRLSDRFAYEQIPGGWNIQRLYP